MSLTILLAKADCKFFYCEAKESVPYPQLADIVDASKNWSHIRLMNAYLIEIPPFLGGHADLHF